MSAAQIRIPAGGGLWFPGRKQGSGSIGFRIFQWSSIDLLILPDAVPR
jgi:hypothetical protein